ncbi:MAG: hypothetical protein K6E86_02070 [Bacteroidales bacterium]|nr:hypothetical protein [Bacteroidales bacterium]
MRILQDADAAYTVGSLDFPAEEPLTIEWAEKDKYEPIQGSVATLRLISPGDRTYEDLYTIEVGKIRMDVYCNDSLYWSGTLDPEFYEEPYAYTEGYEVELVFSDFGILERLRYDLTGVQELSSLIEHIMEATGISTSGIEYGNVSLKTTSGGNGLFALSVRSDNFKDEDGELSSMKDALEAVLQPLALRIIQRGGGIHVYDLHGEYANGVTNEINWKGEDQMMGSDKVLNNAKVTLSTYSNAELLDGEMTYPWECPSNVFSWPYGPTDNYCVLLPSYADEDVERDDYNISFVIYYTSATDKETGLAYRNANAYYYHIRPMLGGEESNGVLRYLKQGTLGPDSLANLNGKSWLRTLGAAISRNTKQVLMRTHQVYIPKMGQTSPYMLRLTQELLVDPRYNPFSEASEGNEEGNFKNAQVWYGYVMIPARVVLRDADGNALYHYYNESVANDNHRGWLHKNTVGRWISGEGTMGDCWLSWYDTEDRSEKSGALGWKTNRHFIGLSTEALSASFKSHTGDGQYLPYPPTGGYLEVEIGMDFWVYDFGETTWKSLYTNADKKDLYSKIRWMLYKAPKLQVVNVSPNMEDAEMDDVEYNSYINPAAKEELELTTMCGTAATPCPTSKALFLNTSTGEQVSELKRAGRTGQCEKLLLGTIYSQYATRHAKLQGTARLETNGLYLYTEASQQGLFILAGEVQDLQAGTCEINVVELRPDEWDESD